MDITVQITDFRSLSQSELIMRNLFSTVTIGSTSHPGRGVLIKDAKFRSGTVENPLVLTFKNSQTDTVMYVRNIPISTVLERSGLFEQWIAVYPPGDPQNLHFDAAATPKEGCPQVCISVGIEEDLTSTVAPQQRTSMGYNFAPNPRLSIEPSSKIDMLQRSVESLKGEPTMDRSSGPRPSFDGKTNGPGGPVMQSHACPLDNEANAGVDSTVREKEIQAQRIKEHVAEMANAQRRAQDASRVLHDNLRILDDMKRQLKGLEMQIAEQRVTMQLLEQDRDQLRKEEAHLQEQIRHRDVMFQELRDSRDEIDRELTRVLSEGERQKHAMEMSSRDFSRQTQSMLEDIDKSKSMVSQLAASLKSKEKLVADSERQARERENSRMAQEAVDRDTLRAQLDQTRTAMAGARCKLEVAQRHSHSVDMDHQETKFRLTGTQSDVRNLCDTARASHRVADGSHGVSVPDAKTDLDVKRDKLEAHAKRVESLEAELGGNRERLEKLSGKIAELHTEAHEKELAAKRCQDEQMELQRKLKLQRQGATEALCENSKVEDQVVQVERELVTAREAVESLEHMAASRGIDQHDPEALDLEQKVQQKRDQLSGTRQGLDALQRSCDDLESQVCSWRTLLRARTSTCETIESRAVELTQQVAAAASYIAQIDGSVRELDMSLSDRNNNLHNASQLLQLQSENIDRLKEDAMKAVKVGHVKVEELDKTAVVMHRQLERLAEAQHHSEMQRSELESALVEGRASLNKMTDQIGTALSSNANESRALSILIEENEQAAIELRKGNKDVEGLEEVASASQFDLESTQGKIALKIQELASLESEFKQDVSRMELEAADLEASRNAAMSAHAELSSQLVACKMEHAQAIEELASQKLAHETIDSELKCASAENVGQKEESNDALHRTEACLQDAINRMHQCHQRNNEARDDLFRIEGMCTSATMQLSSMREEIAGEKFRLHEARARLHEKQRDLNSTSTALDSKQMQASLLQATCTKLEQEINSARASLASQEVVSVELRALMQKHVSLIEEHRTQDKHLEEELKRRDCDSDELCGHLSQHTADVMQKKEEEIRNQVDQINHLEIERKSLLQQASRWEEDRRNLEERLLERKRVCSGVEANSKRKAQECGELESTLRQTQVCSEQLQRRESELQEALAIFAQKESNFLTEAERLDEQIRKVREDVGEACGETEQEVVAEFSRFETLHKSCATEQHEAETQRQACMQLQDEVGAAQTAYQAVQRDEEHIRAQLIQAYKELRDFLSARGEHNMRIVEPVRELDEYWADTDKYPKGLGDAALIKQTVQEFEDSLQQLSDRLVEAQESVRRRRAEEEELRADIQKLRESIRETHDKMAYQVEHSNLQFETMQKLEEQKVRFEDEVEVLTLGLHEAEQRNRNLQHDNSLMQQQVEGLYHGSLQDCAADMHRVNIAAEVVHYREEIDRWKQRADQTRKEKQQELTGLQRQHEEAVRRLRDRIASIQADIDQREQAAKRREVALAKQRAHGEPASPTAAMPGLVVPQRPLPSGHHRRKALLVGINYASSHAPLKGCVNDLWNLQCLLRHTLQYGDDQLRLLIDSVDGRPQKPERAPTKANIQSGLQWLISEAQPGDNLLFIFCGYGAQHPRTLQSDQYEGYIVPVDFAADLPAGFFDAGGDCRSPPGACQGYRLVPLLEISSYISQLPPMCRISVMMDCCYASIPGINPSSGSPWTFAKVNRGQVDYSKLRDFISRPRFLELPILPVQHTPAHLQPNGPIKCWLHAFSGSKLEEWSAEFPIEGTVQGAFSWAFLKALARGHFHCGLYQFQRMLTEMLADLKVHFKGVEQTPVLQLSQSASMQDVVLWT